MIFKRQEGFRFSFGEPLEAKFVILIDGKPFDLERTSNTCKILDISPRGMKISSEVDLNEHINKMLQLEICFTLDVTEIKCVGEIVWSKPFGSCTHYGVVIYNQAAVEDLIINELKLRRRKEVLRSKSE
ncbi:PilZ domain-containing protein [Lysinibacillus sp. 54212]|uniref:PilZ domain-containing protein n=1 Tax=Lysinibacillus sp. 54212 TaxID=3119829 RepID=UPI002FC6BC15